MTKTKTDTLPAITLDLLGRMKAPAPLRLDIQGLPKGIDNYHIDVKLSNRFCKDLKVLIDELLRRETTGEGGDTGDKESLFTPLRQSYEDMMTVLIHRVKTDLSPLEVHFLQFAVPKHILSSVRLALNELINRNKRRASDLRSNGSGEVLKVHQQLAWLSRHYNSITYRVNRQIFEQLHRVERRHLRFLRDQYLHEDLIDFNEFLFNPLLLNRDLNAPQFQIEHYVYWGGNLENSKFPRLNAELEAFLSRHFPELNTMPLKPPPADPPEPTEVYDELGGLHAIRPYMGPAEDSKFTIEETFCWLDYPPNLRKLFDLKQFDGQAAKIRLEQGVRAWWRFRKQVKRHARILRDAARLLLRRRLLRQFIASYQVQKIWGRQISSEHDPRLLCQYLDGRIGLKQLQDPSLGGKPLQDQEAAHLQKSLKDVDKAFKAYLEENMARILEDLARFRLHLKHFRFVHRLFNRMKILTRQEDVQLSHRARTLYQLPTSAEIEEDEDRIVHHSVLKADVRGSTQVTEHLEQKGLNPASYFSLHFFNPINEILPLYGAAKVFIEGDAIILSFLEHENSPQQWFSVARACGLARAMLKIIHANNQHAAQIDLPELELGIGICYSGEAPRYLFDGDRPIMISSSIGHADRLSSSSWQLHNRLRTTPFKVQVLEVAAGEREHGEKGQRHMRYNVNGILLDNTAFDKLRSEIRLHRINARIQGEPVVLYHGEYPDAENKRHRLVIREGHIGLWRDGEVSQHGGDRGVFYEVVTNSRIISEVQQRQEQMTE